jgi:hypothetical protein
MSGEDEYLDFFPGTGVLWTSGDGARPAPGSVTLLDRSRVDCFWRNLGSLDGALWAGDDVREFLLFMSQSGPWLAQITNERSNTPR